MKFPVAPLPLLFSPFVISHSLTPTCCSCCTQSLISVPCYKACCGSTLGYSLLCYLQQVSQILLTGIVAALDVYKTQLKKVQEFSSRPLKSQAVWDKFHKFLKGPPAEYLSSRSPNCFLVWYCHSTNQYLVYSLNPVLPSCQRLGKMPSIQFLLPPSLTCLSGLGTSPRGSVSGGSQEKWKWPWKQRLAS